MQDFTFDRMVNAVQGVRRRLKRSTTILSQSSIPYAVAGGNAVATWVATVDTGAVRFTPDVNILLRRDDFNAAKTALQEIGFIHRLKGETNFFLEDPDDSPRSAVHIIFANEMLTPTSDVLNPDVTESQLINGSQVLSLCALVQIKLTAFRDKDRTHLRDMIDVGLLDETWPARFPAELGARLQLLLDTPEG